MAKESGESVKLSTTIANGNGTGKEGDNTAAIRTDIERTREEMALNVNQIEERLSPKHIKEQIANVTASVTSDIEHKVAGLKQSVVSGYHETKDHIKEDIGREVRDARHMVSDEFTHARAAVREATVGRVEHMVQDARDTVVETGTSILGTIKANPIPAALVGIGLGWLILSARNGSERSRRARISVNRGNAGRFGVDGYAYDDVRDRQRLSDGGDGILQQGQRAIGGAVHAVGEGMSDIGHRVQDGASQLAQGARGAMHDAGDAVSHLAKDAGHRASNLATGAGRQLVRAERGAESLLREYPLAAGAVALAVGAAISLALPSTGVEDQWMGEAKDRLLHQAEELAGDAIHGFEDAAGQLTSGDAHA